LSINAAGKESQILKISKITKESEATIAVLILICLLNINLSNSMI
jgi:hypothetical protein